MTASTTKASNPMQKADFEVAIIGAGFAGLGIAIRLKTSGIDSFVLLEKASDASGVWRDNAYPGCVCDIPSALYSYSFKPSRNWSKMYAPAAEIRQYLRECADSFDLWPHIRLGTQVADASFNMDGNFWTIKAGKDSITARYLISATGALSNPAIPNIDGMNSFKGMSFHTARWDKDFVLKDKNVAVIGVGASGIQVVPELAKTVKNLYLFQRTPPWVSRKADVRDFKGLERFLLRKIPIYHWLLRKWIFSKWEVTALLFDLRFNRFFGRTARKMLDEQIHDPNLRQKLTPDYLYGCKRVLYSNEYLPALNRPNVEVISEKIERIENFDIVTNQRSIRDIDLIVYATGFVTMNKNGEKTVNVDSRIKFQGRDGMDLVQTWIRDGRTAYYGTTAPPGFPNLFFILGPNSGINHNSLIIQMESQFNYIVSCIKYMRKNKLTSFEIKRDRLTKYNAMVQKKLGRTVYTSGCRSFFQDDKGQTYMIWPYSSIRFRFMTRKFDPKSYNFS